MASLGDELLGIVNKLQDLVFNTIGNDSLDLPQIVSIRGNIRCGLIAIINHRLSSVHNRQGNHQCWRISLAETFFPEAAASSLEDP
jgi:hypothetical protein